MNKEAEVPTAQPVDTGDSWLEDALARIDAQDAPLRTSVKPNLPVVVPIPLHLIDESATNPRKRFDDLAELIASIQDHGIETPLRLARRGDRYALIGGARRKRAAEQAGLAEAPAILEAVDDHELRVRQLEDNKNRKDPHPLEDALAYKEAMNDGWTVKDLSRRLGKPASSIYDSLKMTELIPAWQERFFAGEIAAGHAVLLARLPMERQQEALDPNSECWENAWGRPGGDRPSISSVRNLAGWIKETSGEDLSDAPFALDDAELLPSVGACLACPKYSAEHQLCYERSCFNAKVAALVERKTKAGLVAITDGYRPKDVPAGVLRREEFVKVRDAEPPEPEEGNDFDGEEPEAPPADCGHAVEAVIAHGSHMGEVRRICRDLNCPVHGAQLRRMQEFSGASRSTRIDKWEKERAAAEEKRNLELAVRRIAFQRVLGKDANWDLRIEDDFAWLRIRHLTSGYLSVDEPRAVNDAFGYLPATKGKKAPKENAEVMKKALLKAAADWEGQGKRARLIVFLVLHGAVERGQYAGEDLLKDVASEKGVELSEIQKELTT